jgi:hypothetical protein
MEIACFGPTEVRAVEPQSSYSTPKCFVCLARLCSPAQVRRLALAVLHIDGQRESW